MQIVYAEGDPRFLEFQLADRWESVPPDALVFAVCTGDRTIENQDEDLFRAITDEEYYALRALVARAERAEEQRRAVTHASAQKKPLHRFCGWLLGLVFGRQAEAKGSL